MWYTFHCDIIIYMFSYVFTNVIVTFRQVRPLSKNISVSEVFSTLATSFTNPFSQINLKGGHNRLCDGVDDTVEATTAEVQEGR